MKLRYRLFRRSNGIYFCEDRESGTQQTQLKEHFKRVGDVCLRLALEKAFVSAL